jgi:hypothetical protein
MPCLVLGRKLLPSVGANKERILYMLPGNSPATQWYYVVAFQLLQIALKTVSQSETA